MRTLIEKLPASVPEEKRRYYVYGSYVYLFALAAHALFIPVFHLLGNTAAFYNNILCAVLDAACLALHRRGHLSTATFIFLCAISYHTSYCILAFGDDTGLPYYYLTMTAVVFFSGWRFPYKAAGALVLAMLCVFMYRYAGTHAPFTPLTEQVLLLWHTSNALANVIAIAYSAYYFLRVADAAEESLRYQATHDYLTGTLNRKTIIELLETEVSRTRREKRCLGVIMSDIDHFKRLNDTRGHLAGDAVLRETAAILSSMLRPYDLMGRYGGEEFIIVIPGASLAAAHAVAERMRIAVESRSLSCDGCEMTVTMSFGVTAVENSALDYSVDGIIEIADRALYAAKNRGRNRAEKHRLDVRALRDGETHPGAGENA